MKGLLENDSYDQTLINHVHPSDWENPSPSEPYNLVVIGGGSAGLISAAGAAGLGAKVALIEGELLGGDCLNFGCVPSKALIRASRAIANARELHQFGGIKTEITVDFAKVMERMRRLRSEISHHDSARRFSDLGIDVYIGHGQFCGNNKIDVGGQTLTFKKAIIATGAKAFVPPIPGIFETNYKTNETLFALTKLPKKIAIIGAGPIGCELAQSFARFGSQVFLIQIGPQILGREDRDAADIVQASMEKDGVIILVNTSTKSIIEDESGFTLVIEQDNTTQNLKVDELLVATGRRPNVNSLNAEAAGVQLDKRKGIVVNNNLQSSNSDIYAAGDCCSAFQFTHAADAYARIAIQNALFIDSKKTNDLVIPFATYTSPEIAHVGYYPKEAEEAGYKIDTFTTYFKDLDRAILDGETEGFLKVHLKKDSDKILGATLVGSHAGDLLAEITFAMTHDMGFGTIAATIHPYPTQSEIVKRAADAYNRTRLTSFVSGAMEKYFSWRR